MEISDLKGAASLLTRYYIIQNMRRLSNKVLCIHVAQGAAKLPKIKVEGPKKDKKMSWVEPTINIGKRRLTFFSDLKL